MRRGKGGLLRGRGGGRRQTDRRRKENDEQPWEQAEGARDTGLGSVLFFFESHGPFPFIKTVRQRGRVDHEREGETIRRRYRSIPSYQSSLRRWTAPRRSRI